jgi:hypothetical protein
MALLLNTLLLLFSLYQLPILSLNSSCASKIGINIFMQIYLQAYLKVLVESIMDLFYSCSSLSCNKLCFNKLLNNSNSCFIVIVPKSITFLACLTSFSFHFPFFISFTITLSMVFSLKYLGIQQKSQPVTKNNQLMVPSPLCVL